MGKTGAGKSTLADMVLGLLEPSSGEVRWQAGAGSGVRLGFVPQDVFLTSGSIAENVALGVSPDTIDLDEVWAALTSARLDSVVDSQPKGIWTLIGERGVRLSGGERQRLGVARALYRQPSLLILDEATSSVDASTEHELTSVLNGLRGKVTTLIIAHRLATIRDADLVVLLADGSVRAHGSFADVAAADPAFAPRRNTPGSCPHLADPGRPHDVHDGTLTSVTFFFTVVPFSCSDVLGEGPTPAQGTKAGRARRLTSGDR